MGVAGHIFQNALGLPEELGNILDAAGKGTADMSALLRQGFCLIIRRRIISVKEYLRLLKDGEIVEIPFIFHNRLAQIGQQGGTDIA